jgi:hypothetical protein
MATDLPLDLWIPAEDDTYRPSLTTPALEAMFRAVGLGPRVAVVDGPDIPADPGTVIVVTWLPGAGFSLEQMLDTPGFQLRVIGPQGNYPAAKELAERVDLELVARDHWPGFIGGRYVVEIRRAGGKPSHDRTDNADRAHYVCTYLADVEAQ